jgi:hypothetical protein
MTHFIHESVIAFLKFMTVSGGMLASLIALLMIARRCSERNVLGRIIPHLLILMVFWAAYLFIFLGTTGGGEVAAAPHASVVGQAEPARLSPTPTPTPSPAQAPVSSQATSGAVQQSTGLSAPATPPATARSEQAGPTPAATPSFSLITPDIKGANYGRLDQASVLQWTQTARPVPGSKQVSLAVQGEVNGAPTGAKVRGSLETGGTLSTQFTAALDQKGRFNGEIVVNSANQRIPLVLELLDARANTVLISHRVVLY